MRGCFLFLLIFLSGCAPYKHCTRCVCSSYSQCFDDADPCSQQQESNREAAQTHWLYKVVPRHRSQIRWYSVGHWCTWALLGNDDDGIFGEEPTANYHSRRSAGVVRAAAWTTRNPLHNFFFYVIGSAHRKNSELTLLGLGKGKATAMNYKPEAETVFLKEHGNSLYLGLHGGKPFLSFQLYYGRQCNAYIGWREKGNFGMKLNPFKKVEKTAPAAALSGEQGWHGASEDVGDSSE